jgi:hypothetical protein
MGLPDWDEVSKAIERSDYEFVLKNAMPHALAGNSDAQAQLLCSTKPDGESEEMSLRPNAGCLKPPCRTARWLGIT